MEHGTGNIIFFALPLFFATTIGLDYSILVWIRAYGKQQWSSLFTTKTSAKVIIGLIIPTKSAGIAHKLNISSFTWEKWKWKWRCLHERIFFGWFCGFKIQLQTFQIRIYISLLLENQHNYYYCMCTIFRFFRYICCGAVQRSLFQFNYFSQRIYTDRTWSWTFSAEQTTYRKGMGENGNLFLVLHSVDGMWVFFGMSAMDLAPNNNV